VIAGSSAHGVTPFAQTVAEFCFLLLLAELEQVRLKIRSLFVWKTL
jgi:hypothetical protein